MSGILKHPGKLKDAEVAKRVRESWDEAFSGDNAFKTPLIEDGMDWVQVSMTNKDAQYVESMKFRNEDIARIFRVQPHKIGMLDKATFSNIEQQGIDFVTDTMMPWFRRWEQAIYRDLLTPAQRKSFFAEFLIDGLLRGDTAARGEFYAKQYMLGAISPNEIRAMENRNPIDGGDTYYRQLNMEPIGSAGGSDNAA